jgi:chromosome segregation ATPase
MKLQKMQAAQIDYLQHISEEKDQFETIKEKELDTLKFER